MLMAMLKAITRPVWRVLLFLGTELDMSRAAACRKFQVGSKVVSAVANAAFPGGRLAA